MSSLGSLGHKKKAVDLDFDYFGDTIRVNPGVSKLTVVEFLAQAGEVDEADEIRGARLIMLLLREVIHPEDFDRFWALAKQERQDTEELMEIAKAVMETVAGFPTGQSSDSSSGPASTPQKFTVDLPSQDIPSPALAPAGTSTADKALAMLRGRPDLQEFVVQAEEAGTGRNGKALTG
jgi:hypothetical protein